MIPIEPIVAHSELAQRFSALGSSHEGPKLETWIRYKISEPKPKNPLTEGKDGS